MVEKKLTCLEKQAIVDGLRESVMAFANNVSGTSPKDVLDMVLVTQYFDTMKVCFYLQEKWVHVVDSLFPVPFQEIGSSAKSTAVFLPHGPGHVQDIAQQIRNGQLQANVKFD